jgi:hypothetical protein
VRQYKLTTKVFLAFNIYVNTISNFQVRVIPDFRSRNNTIGFVPDIDHDFTIVPGYDGPFNDFMLGYRA